MLDIDLEGEYPHTHEEQHTTQHIHQKAYHRHDIGHHRHSRRGVPTWSVH